jgi:hypothetical protein
MLAIMAAINIALDNTIATICKILTARGCFGFLLIFLLVLTGK